MASKLVYATELRSGNFAIINKVSCAVKSIDISKTGKHGHAKVRIEAIGILDGKKKIIVVPGSERIQVPMIDKRKAQILSINKEEEKANVMDMESFETFEIEITPDLIDDISEGAQAEYWNIEGKKIIKRLT